MDVGAALVAEEQVLEVVQPGQAALDHPAEAAEPGAVRALAPGDLGADAALAKEAVVIGVVVASVGGQPLGAQAGRPTAPRTSGTASRRGSAGVVVVVASTRAAGDAP